MSKILRGLVSKKKRRYTQGGYDLDLSYITPRIIAMGFPCEGREAAFRNPYREVYKFLEERHKDHYKVYNLCIEKDRQYDAAKFHGRVGLFQFEDHNPPAFQLFEAFCIDTKAYLDDHPDNIVAIHCKAGKGRTGTVIVAFLVYIGFYDNLPQSLKYYAAMRTYNQKGLTIPSQIRYCGYFCESLEFPEGQKPVIDVPAPSYMLNSIAMLPPPFVDKLATIRFRVFVDRVLVYTHKEAPVIVAGPGKPKKEKKDKDKKKQDKVDKAAKRASEKNLAAAPAAEGEAAAMGTYTNVVEEAAMGAAPPTEADGSITFPALSVPVRSDVKVMISLKGDKFLQMWFNTAFIKGQEIVLLKHEVGGSHKDRKSEKFAPNFRIVFRFSEAEDGPAAPKQANNEPHTNEQEEEVGAEPQVQEVQIEQQAEQQQKSDESKDKDAEVQVEAAEDKDAEVQVEAEDKDAEAQVDAAKDKDVEVKADQQQKSEESKAGEEGALKEIVGIPADVDLPQVEVIMQNPKKLKASLVSPKGFPVTLLNKASSLEPARYGPSIASDILSSLLNIIGRTSHVNSLLCDTVAASERFPVFVRKTALLSQVDLSESTEEQKVAFWLNVYHTLMLHMHLSSGALGVTSKLRPRLACAHSYRVCGTTLTLWQIEHGILRGNLPPPDSFHQAFKGVHLDDDQKALALQPSPLITFGTSYCAPGTPNLRVYDENSSVEGQLRYNANIFIGDNLVTNTSKRVATLPVYFKWYMSYFGDTPKEAFQSWIGLADSSVDADTVVLLSDSYDKFKWKYEDVPWKQITISKVDIVL